MYFLQFDSEILLGVAGLGVGGDGRGVGSLFAAAASNGRVLLVLVGGSFTTGSWVGWLVADHLVGVGSESPN